MLLTQQLRVQSSAFPKIHFGIAEIYQWRWLEESGQLLESVDRTHLVLASGKLVPQKNISSILPQISLSPRIKIEPKTEVVEDHVADDLTEKEPEPLSPLRDELGEEQEELSDPERPKPRRQMESRPRKPRKSSALLKRVQTSENGEFPKTTRFRFLVC